MSWMLAFATKVSAAIVGKLIVSASRQIRKILTRGDAEKKALARSIEAGILCMLQDWDDQEADDGQRYEPVLTEFFDEPEVCRELEALLAGRDWREENLLSIFEECCSADFADLMDDVDFQHGLHTFRAAFLANAFAESVLQDLIKLHHVAEQTELLKAILAELRNLPELVTKLPGTEINGENVVSGVQIITKMVNGGPDPESLQATYLNAFRGQCDALDLSITDDKYTHDEDHAVSLSEVFTRLYLDGITRAADEPVAEVIKKQRKTADDLSQRSGKEKESLPVTALEAIDAVDRLVITGHPGGGKSTLVNYLFVQLAQARLQGKLIEGWTGQALLPVRIILRQFAKRIPNDATKGQAGQIWDYLRYMIAEKTGQAAAAEILAYVRRTLEGEGGIVFFDGLDEVGYGAEVSKRDVIKEAVQDFSSQLKAAKIIITSRPYAYRRTDSWRLPATEYPVVDLALFSRDQVKAFARNWYQKVGKTVKGWDEVRCAKMTRDFGQALDAREGLFAIVTNPLLLTMAVQLHSRDNFLPHKRAELYSKVIELLLARWENNIVRDIEALEDDPGSDAIPRLQLSMKKMLTALARIAFNCHCRQLDSGGSASETADITRGDLLVELEKDFDSALASRIIEYIQFRTGILQGKDNLTFSFMHRTFQEYLAARHMLELEAFDTEICGRLEGNLEWWREVFLLMAGSAETRRAVTIRDLVASLLGDKTTLEDFAPDADFKKLLLAAQTLWETDYQHECLATNKEAKGPDRGVFGRVYACLSEGLTASDTLAASQRAWAGKWLSRLGDDRQEVLDSAQMAFCRIAKGAFWLGDGKDDDCPQALCNELDYDYWLSTTPVTVSQFKQFSDAGGYQKELYWPEAVEAKFWQDGKVKFWRDKEWRPAMPDLSDRFNDMNHPMVEISWFESLAYCRWLTELLREGEVVRNDLEGVDWHSWFVTLPSEAEWEKGARGCKDKRLYPCGDKISPNQANYSETGIECTSAVGCFPKGSRPNGCQDMAGNVWEWCRNTLENYPYKRDAREDVAKNVGSPRVIRGGSWGSPSEDCRCSYRYGIDPGYRDDSLGFRVVLVPSSLSPAR